MAKEIKIKLDDPGITRTDLDAAVDAIESSWLVNGPRARELESELQKITGRSHAIATSSGTTALLAAMRALGVGHGSTVIVPAFTFPAPAAVAAFLGAEVRVCDVDPATFCVSPATIEPHLDSDVSLVVAIDQFGMPAPVPDLEELLEPRGVPVLVDAACSIGSTLNNTPCGSLGTVAIFSFHPRKIVTTGEGGAVLTDYDQIASRARRSVNHGLEGGEFMSMGLNLRMSEIGAAIGKTQLGRLSDIITARRALARRYQTLPIQFQKAPTGAETNQQTVAALLPKPLTSSDRTDLLETLGREGIEAGIASYCLGSVPAIARKLGTDAADTPVARELHERGIALPLHPKLDEKEVDEVAAVMFNWLRSRGVE
ncbi:MAG: DegT/DnrJ/EryC1/StrS family aminotransferase [Deltaproteobacteria bacterium]|nr:DegT/DnrJ/EryC1/StrS family aminotransferase [Deltaproteobacteria bacterium]